jgi:hypothetical protein
MFPGDKLCTVRGEGKDIGYKPRQNIVYLSAELNRLGRIRVSTDISIRGSHLLAASFCLYTAWLLVEMLHPGYSRFNSAPA